MRSRIVIACASLALATSGCSGPQPLSGRVDAPVIELQVPEMSAPSPDVKAGLSEADPSESGGARSRTSTVVAMTGLESRAQVASVAVAMGESVAAGQLIARLDGRAIDAEVDASRAARRVALAQVAVVGDALAEVDEGRADVAEGRRKARDAIAGLADTRATLVAQRASLADSLAKLESMRPPPRATPPTNAPAPVRPPGLPDPARLRAGIAKLDSAIARIDSGLAQARSALGRLAAARSRLADARATLVDLRELARIAASAAAVPERIAEERQRLLAVTAPCDGMVVDIASTGDVLAPGATIAVLRQAEAERTITTWLSPDAAATLRSEHASAIVEVSADWQPGVRARGRVSRVGHRAQYPATSFATTDVHLSRAVDVTIVIEDSDLALPPGAPVDVWIQ